LIRFLERGTTGVACVRTGRKFIGIEIRRDYCEIADQEDEREVGAGILFEPVKLEPIAEEPTLFR